VYVTSIHYPNEHYYDPKLGDNGTILEASEVTMKWVTSVHQSDPDALIVVMGDFNDQPSQHLSYCVYTRGQLLQNTHDMQSGQDPSKPCPTDGKGFNGIDQIYASPLTGLTAQGWTHMGTDSITRRASDHHPVYVTLSMGGDDSSGTTASKDGWSWPVADKDYKPLSQCYQKPGHTGIDIPEPVGINVLAARDGVVVKTDPSGSSDGGKYIIIKHDNGLYTNYQHNSQLLVNEGDKVSAGQVIAKSGNTGFTTGPHVHFSITTQEGLDSRTKVAYSVDPLNYLPTVSGRNLGGCQ
jgi:hypothetical protein